MVMAIALWDVLAKVANVAQMTAVGASLLRIVRQSKRECAELERCSRRLRALLQSPMGCGVVLLCSEMGGPVVDALGDAARLVDAYNGSTLWRRFWSAGRTASQLREMQDVINFYCGLLLYVNAYVLLEQQAAHRHPIIPPSPDATTIHEDEVNGLPQIQRAEAVTISPQLQEQAVWQLTPTIRLDVKEASA